MVSVSVMALPPNPAAYMDGEWAVLTTVHWESSLAWPKTRTQVMWRQKVGP